MTGSIPTSGQLERTLSQRVQALFRDQMGHRLERVTCQLLEQKIVILLENSVTQPEQLLANSGKEELVEKVHLTLNEAIEPQIKELIEEVVGVSVVDLLSEAKLETERTGMIAVLAEAPQVSDRTTNSKPATRDRRAS
ncbi:MAG: DUF2294 domain-containing protein [Leptolyngbyaceae cyanobacterium RU_5_1]|nr:DUF2294 domain-containing protein [Leptolyngbyaceae cyanobacterium RU_5_1]